MKTIIITTKEAKVQKQSAGGKYYSRRIAGAPMVRIVTSTVRPNAAIVYFSDKVMDMFGTHEVIFNERQLYFELPTLASRNTRKINPSGNLIITCNSFFANDLVGTYDVHLENDKFYLTKLNLNQA